MLSSLQNGSVDLLQLYGDQRLNNMAKMQVSLINLFPSKFAFMEDFT